MKLEIGNGSLALRYRGDLKMVYGGPYRNKPQGMPGVKLAKEIKAYSTVKCDIADFSVPSDKDAQRALAETLVMLKTKNVVYVGCMGGWGRTGLFLSLLVKVLWDVENDKEASRTWPNPVAYVRQEYSGRAVETKEQEAFVREFDTRLLRAVEPWL